MSPRIIDIAKTANVSPSAVSLALNNKTGVSDEVRQRIITIASEMGYRNRGAGLYINENIAIRLLKIVNYDHILNERHITFITEYMEAIEAETKKRKYKLEVSFYNKAPVEDIIKDQEGITADGLIILGTELNIHDLDFFTSLSRPMVFIDTWFPMAVFDCVDMDNEDGVFQSIQYLYNCGHRSIGLVKSRSIMRNFTVREESFRESMEFFSLPVQEKYIISTYPTVAKTAMDMSRFLDKNSSLPTAFFCMNDIMAYGCIQALRDHNIQVPRDVSITGFDDIPFSSIIEPSLTTIRVSTHQIVQRALDRLSDKVSGLSHTNPEKILVAGKLIIRNSVRNL
jgi:LacI family transcriptional regulator